MNTATAAEPGATAVPNSWSALRSAFDAGLSPERYVLDGGRDWLLLDGAPGAAADGLESESRFTAWVARLPLPVVVRVADEQLRHPLLEACDARIGSDAEVRAVEATVARAPLAALTLVQTLRACERLDADTALDVESLAYATLQAGAEYAAWHHSGPRPEPVADTEPAVLIERDAAQLRLRLNRPQARNALNTAMRDGLIEAFELVAADASIERAVVSGVGRCYSVGGDLAEFGTRPDPATAHRVRSLHHPARALLRCRERLVFELHGACIGSGIELPAFGAQVRAARDAWFQLPELRYGLIPGSGGCISLPRRIGRQRTAWLALTGQRIDAACALHWGLIDALHDG